jgi:tRNA pseudouridine55 synthase
MRQGSSTYDGVLLVNKPPGVSSHEAVQRLRGMVRQRRIGHTGTLDPMATGLLLACMGRGTKDICLGRQSPTYDSEGIEESTPPTAIPHLTQQDIEKGLQGFQGRIRQKVPAYSAVQVGGQRLYSLARSGIEVDCPEREVEIRRIELLGYQSPRLTIRVACSKGTYIRSLAHDLGVHLGCGAYLSGLRRTAVGKFLLRDALALDDVPEAHAGGTLGRRLLDSHQVLDYSAVVVTEEFEQFVVSGRSLRETDVSHVEGDFAVGDTISLKDRRGRVVAVGTAEVDSSRLRANPSGKLFTYIRVLN